MLCWILQGSHTPKYFSFSHRLNVKHALHHTVAEPVFLSKRALLILAELQQILNSKVIVTLEETQNTWASLPFLLSRINTESPFMLATPCVVLLPFQYSTYAHRKNTSNSEIQLSKERQKGKNLHIQQFWPFKANVSPSFPEECSFEIPCCSAGPP